VYVSYLHPTTAVTGTALAFSLRVDGAPAGAAPRVRDVLAETAPDVPPFDFETGRARNERLLGPERTLTGILLVFGAVAVFLSSLGLYGVLSYVVRRRTREVAVRAAVGATRAQVVRLIIRESVVPVIFGIIAGVGAALFADSAIERFLFGVPAHDPVALGAACAVLLVTSILAAALPGLRASRTNAAAALRAE
jgi:ABC-type antimicrobial peptide transport system permease subunit